MTALRSAAGLAALAAVIVAGAVGCGGSSSGSAATTAAPTTGPEVSPSGDIPDNQAYVAFRPSGAAFTVKVPEGWSRTSTGGAVTFGDKLNSITVQSQPATSALTVARARATELPQLAKSVPGYQAGTVTTVKRTAGTAVRITYLSDAKPDPVTGKAVRDAVERYVFFHNGRAVVLTLTGPKGADNVDPWRIVTDSVRWTA